MPVKSVKWCMWLIAFRGRGRVGADRRLSPGPELRSGLTGGEGLAGWGLALFTLEESTRPNTRLLDVRKGRGDQHSCRHAAFPRPDLWKGKHSFLNKLMVEDLGCVSVRVCEWSRLSWKLEEGDEEA